MPIRNGSVHFTAVQATRDGNSVCTRDQPQNALRIHHSMLRAPVLPYIAATNFTPPFFLSWFRCRLEIRSTHLTPFLPHNHSDQCPQRFQRTDCRDVSQCLPSFYLIFILVSDFDFVPKLDVIASCLRLRRRQSSHH